jgi:hypothetical protein
VWKPVQGRRPSDVRQARFRSVLLAALNTRYYGPVLRSAGLGTPEEIGRLNSIEETLARIPRAEPGYVKLASGAAINRAAPAAGPRELFWPLPPARRTAVLAPGFRMRKGLRTFNGTRAPRFTFWTPEALAGPVAALQRLADQVEDRWRRMPALSHSVLAFVLLRQGFLSEETRDRFWRVFRVPVFGQIFGLSGELLAWECEAHEGYHIDEDRAVIEIDHHLGQSELLVTSLAGLWQPAIRLATGLAAGIEHSPCGCGRDGPRLVDVRRKSRQMIAAARAACAAD